MSDLYDQYMKDPRYMAFVMDILFFPIFPTFSCPFLCTYATFTDLVVSFVQQLSYHTDTSLSPLFHVTNGNVPVV